MNLIESLHTEIQFWEDMLSQQVENAEPETLDRIQMAKLLAVKKLSLYSSDCEKIAH